MEDAENDEIYSAFHDAVNMAPKELEEWLGTEESKAVGSKPEQGGESVGHASGRRIVKIKRTKKDELTDDDYEHMRKVVGYVRRHCAQGPAEDKEHSRWRYSLVTGSTIC